ncbi:MAG: DUF2321 domain-containing protein [Rhizomicrobium sp.]
MSNDWMLGGSREVRSWHDQMQVCLNGHRITANALGSPEFREDFCSRCGMRTIMACEKCRTPIQGEYHVENVFAVGMNTPVPKYCTKCGSPYPWQEAAIENLKEALREGGLDSADIQAAELALPDIMHDTPKTELASLKFGRILKKLGKPVYEVAIKVVTDVASEAAKKALGLG